VPIAAANQPENTKPPSEKRAAFTLRGELAKRSGNAIVNRCLRVVLKDFYTSIFECVVAPKHQPEA
jgi:hypothetical protein